MQIVSEGYNLHVMSNILFIVQKKKKKKIMNLSSAESAQRVLMGKNHKLLTIVFSTGDIPILTISTQRCLITREQWRAGPACTSALSEQCLCNLLMEYLSHAESTGEKHRSNRIGLHISCSYTYRRTRLPEFHSILKALSKILAIKFLCFNRVSEKIRLGRRFTWNDKPYFLWKLQKQKSNGRLLQLWLAPKRLVN